MRATDWNAAAYDAISDPQFAWGMAVLETVELAGNERVLDAGCGSGRLTEELLRRLPTGEVVALDSSPQMLEQARQRLCPSTPTSGAPGTPLQSFGARVEFVQASLQDFTLDRTVDGIFSNAVFHWVPDHEAMFRCLHRALKPAGWLIAQFGGVGNLQRTHLRADEVAEHAPFREYLCGMEYGPHYEDVESTRRRMEAAGFSVSKAGLHMVQARFESRERCETFLRTVVLRQPVAKLPAKLQDEFLHEVSRRTLHEEGSYLLDYVRLTVRANS